MPFERPRTLVDADPDGGTYYATYHYPARPSSVAVALALMDITDSDMTDLDPMYDAASVNADAVDDLFGAPPREADHDGHVTFTYHDFEVTGQESRTYRHPLTDSPNKSIV